MTGEKNILLFFKTPTANLRPTQPFIQYTLEGFAQRTNSPQLRLLLRLRMNATVLLLPLYLYLSGLERQFIFYFGNSVYF